MSDYSPAAAEVKQLRDATGAGMMDCKKALIWSQDLDRAVEYLREKGLASVAKRAGRSANQGLVDAYALQQHRRGARRGQLRDRLRGQDRGLPATGEGHRAHREPLRAAVLTRDEVPQDEIDRERHFAEVQAKGRKPSVIEKIVEEDQRLPQGHRAARPAVREGRLEEVRNSLDETSAKVGERIAVRRFARFKLGEAGDDEATDGGES